MSFIDTPHDDDLDDNDTGDENNDLRNLRNTAKRAKQLERENAELAAKARRADFLEAGIEVGTPLGQMFMDAYKGPLEPEAIKAAYAQLGVAPAATDDASTEETISAEERAQTRERQGLAAGAVGDTGETPPEPVRGPEGRAARVAHEAMRLGASREEALAGTFHTLVEAAANGDSSVIVGAQR